MKRIGTMALTLALVAGLAPRAGATDYNDKAGGNWNATSTWNPSTGYPGTNDTAAIDSHTVSITNALLTGTTAPASITLDGAGVFQSQKDWTTLQVDSPITLNGGTIRGLLNGGYRMQFNGPMTVAGNGTWDAQYLGYLTMAGPIAGTGTVTVTHNSHGNSAVTIASGFNTNWTGTLNLTGTQGGTFTVSSNQGLGSLTVNISGSGPPALIFGAGGDSITDVHDYRSIPAPRINVFSNGQVRVNNGWRVYSVTLLGVDIALHNGGTLAFGPMSDGRCGGRLYLTNGVGNLYGYRDGRWGTDNYLESEIIGSNQLIVNAGGQPGQNFHLTGNNTNFSGGITLLYNNLDVEHTNALGTGPVLIASPDGKMLLDRAGGSFDWTLANDISGGCTNGSTAVAIQVEDGAGNNTLTVLGTVDPGTNGVTGAANIVSILRVDGSVAFGAGSKLKIDILGTNGVAGVDFDRLLVDHNLTGLANATLEVNVNTNLAKHALAGQEFVIVSNATALAGPFGAVVWNAPWNGRVRYNDPAGTVKLIQVGMPAGSVLMVY